MSFSAHEQDMYDFAKASLPRFLFQKSTAPEDWIGPFAKIFGSAFDQVVEWLGQTYILNATGIWLDQHARDRGTARQGGESDAALRSRLRTIDDAVIPSALLAAATAALNADSVTIPSGYPALVETRRDGAFFGVWSATPPTPPGSGYASRGMAYFQRGYRMRGPRGSIVVILPFGTSEATRLSVQEAVRKKKAAGFAMIVERRVDP